MITPLRLGLILTYKCNALCRHCYFNAGPTRTEKMNRNDVLNYLDQATDLSTLRMISFTGGEPFLQPDLLREAVSYAVDRGFKTEVVTNCFWADSKETAETQLSSLARAGLDVINLSADDFHQEFIPFSYVKSGYEAAKSLGLKITILCTVARSSRLTAEKIVSLLGDRKIQIVGENTAPSVKGYAMAVETPFIPVGRGSQIPREEWAFSRYTAGPCSHVLRDIAIDPSGRVLPCCSAAGTIEALTLGDARREHLSRIIERGRERNALNVLAVRGPQELLERGEEAVEDYVNKCHLCYEVLSDLERRGLLRV